MSGSSKVQNKYDGQYFTSDEILDIIRKDHTLGLDSLYRVNIKETEKNGIRVVAPFIEHALNPKKRKGQHLAGQLDDAKQGLGTTSHAQESNAHHDQSLSNPRHDHAEDPQVTGVSRNGRVSHDGEARAGDASFGANAFNYEEPNRNISVYDYRVQQQLMEERLK